MLEKLKGKPPAFVVCTEETLIDIMKL